MYTTFCVLIIAVQLASGASTKRSIDDPHPIKFPGAIKEITNKFGTVDDEVIITIPDECKGKNYCTVKPPDYPQEVFNEMFKDYKPVPLPVVEEEDELGNRRHGDPGDTDGCETKVTYEPLYHVRSQEGAWRTVIQAPDQDYVQRVRLEECKNTKKRCFAVFPDIGIETSCKQKYNVWKVLVATGNNGSETIRAELPVCCSCKYREMSKTLSELLDF